jgi:FkbM family methyltransferase
VEHGYGQLDVRGAVVIDIGANIGDTALYFISQGPHLVLSYEPFSTTFNLAVNNVRRNHMEDRIHLIQAGASSESGSITVTFDSGTASIEMSTISKKAFTKWSRRKAGRQERVDLLSLSNILDQALAYAGGRPIVCKVDCEGAEFDIFLGSPLPDSFGKVRQVLIESHDKPPDPLERLLRDHGFEVKVMPIGQKRLLNLITASRQSRQALPPTTGGRLSNWDRLT